MYIKWKLSLHMYNESFNNKISRRTGCVLNLILGFHPDPCNAEGSSGFPAVNSTVIEDDVSRPLVSLIFWSMESIDQADQGPRNVVINNSTVHR